MATRAMLTVRDMTSQGDAIDLQYRILLYGDINDSDTFTITVTATDTPAQIRTKLVITAKETVADRVSLPANSILFQGFDRG